MYCFILFIFTLLLNKQYYKLMLIWKARVILILIGLGVSFTATARIAFFHYGTERGLPEASIVSVSQDSSGFIWLASETNLYRFDGTRFDTYRNTSASLISLSFGTINMLYTDKNGTLWVGSTSGIASYNPQTDLFIHHKNDWRQESVSDIAEDKKGNIWLATNGGLAKIDKETRQTVWYSDSLTVTNTGNNVLPVHQITHLACTDDGKIWFSDISNILYIFDPVSLTIEEFIPAGITNLKNIIITELLFSNNMLFISTLSRGIFWMNPSEKIVQNEVLLPYGHAIHDISVSNDSLIWMAGNNGLFHFNYKTGSYKRYIEEPGNPLSMNRTAITFLYEDREKNLWISSELRGIDYGLTNTPFRHLSHSGKSSYQLSRPEVTAMDFDRQGNMWIGYEDGFIEKHSHLPPNKTIYNLKANNDTGKPGTIFKIFPDNNNRIWFGGLESGLQKLNQAGTAFEIAPIAPDSIANLLKAADIRGITEDSSGIIWVGFHGIGIGRYEPETHKMELFRQNPQFPDKSLASDWVFDICTDNNNNLWIATSEGVSRLNPQSRTFQNYYNDEANPSSLNSNTINTIFCEPGGMIWAGTNKGLNAFIPKQDAFIPIVIETDNTPYNISGIQSAKAGEIWASTRSGIILLSWKPDSLQESLSIKTQLYNRRCGLLSTVYFPRSAAINKEGMIFFGGNEGIDFFYPEQAAIFQSPTPDPVLTEITIDGMPVMFNLSKPESKILKLNQHNRMISIRFTAPAFNHPQRQKFRYRLEGFDKQWHYTVYEQVATYTNLPPGQYTFRVETENRNENQEQKAVFFSMIIQPPFWKTITFYIFITVLLISLILLIIFARSRILLLRQKELEKIIDTRTKELLFNNAELEGLNQTKNKLFSIISHDLRSPFAGILGILELLSDKETKIEEERKTELLVMAKNSAENTFELLENLLTWAHSQMKKTMSKPEQQNLSNILDKNIQLKKASAQQKEIEIHKNFPNELEAWFDQDMVNTVIRNLLNNAIKFTHPGGKITISAFSDNGEVKVSIADTGVGIPPEDEGSLFYDTNTSRKGTMGEKGTGLGLIICREFVEKNAGRIWMTANQPKGTVFNFTLPSS
jgi:signal transduction histidine kinase/ligand-binding sensor domain-containing protein